MGECAAEVNRPKQPVHAPAIGLLQPEPEPAGQGAADQQQLPAGGNRHYSDQHCLSQSRQAQAHHKDHRPEKGEAGLGQGSDGFERASVQQVIPIQAQSLPAQPPRGLGPASTHNVVPAQQRQSAEDRGPGSRAILQRPARQGTTAFESFEPEGRLGLGQFLTQQPQQRARAPRVEAWQKIDVMGSGIQVRHRVAQIHSTAPWAPPCRSTDRCCCCLGR